MSDVADTRVPERSNFYGFLNGRRRCASGPQINVTPLIDVLLTLIIMFMLVVSMDKEYQEKVQIPQPPKDRTSEPTPERTVVIQVDLDDEGCSRRR